MDPKAKPNLVVDELLDETLVYDTEGHRAHCLNATAGFLLRSVDGRKSASQLTDLARTEFGPGVTPEVVGVGLERLHKAGLIEWEGAPEDSKRLTRRETLKKLALVGLLLPTVATLVSPHPAQAATGLPIANCALDTVGLCCANNKVCVQTRQGSFKCTGLTC